MTSQEWNSYSDREKMLYKKGYYLAIDELEITSIEKETKKFSFDTYLKLLETIK